MRYLVILAIVLLYSLTGIADTKLTIKNVIDSYLNTHFLNATFIFANDNEILNSGAHGVSFAEEGVQLKTNAKMPIASVTKPITAAAILRLQDQSKLNVNDKISKFFGPNSEIWNNKMPKWAEEISIHNLLTHTSGLAEYYMHLKIDAEESLSDITKSIMNFAATKPLAFNIGTAYRYTNTNFVILGLIIEKVSGKSLAEFFNDEFFKPLGMKSTHLPSLEEVIEIENSSMSDPVYPVRYKAIVAPKKIKLEVEKFDSILIPYGDGGIISNTKDIVTWYKALCKGKLLSDESYRMMTQKYIYINSNDEVKKYIGYGVFISEFPNKDIMISSSGSKGAISEAGCIPNKNLYFAILGNVSTDSVSTTNTKGVLEEESHIDIVHFRDAVLNAIEHLRNIK